MHTHYIHGSRESRRTTGPSPWSRAAPQANSCTSSHTDDANLEDHDAINGKKSDVKLKENASPNHQTREWDDARKTRIEHLQRSLDNLNSTKRAHAGRHDRENISETKEENETHGETAGEEDLLVSAMQVDGCGGELLCFA